MTLSHSSFKKLIMKKLVVIYLVILFSCLSSNLKAQEFRGGEIWFERLGTTEYDFYFDIYLYSTDSIIAPTLPIIYMELINDTASLELTEKLDHDITLLRYKSNYHVPGVGMSFLVRTSDPFILPELLNYQSNNDSFYLYRSFYIPNPIISLFNNSPYYSNFQTNQVINNGVWFHDPQVIDDEENQLSLELIDFNSWSNSSWEIDYSFPEAANSFSIDSLTGLIIWDGVLNDGFYMIGIKVTETSPVSGYLSEIYRIMIVEITEDDIISPIINLNEYNDIQIFPNPVQNILGLTIEGEWSKNNSTAIFTNLLGQVVHQEAIPSFDENWQRQFDLSEYPNGIYFITIRNDSKIITKEFIIQR